ncbi:hypothetical protein [Halobacterium hubeiense]|uniref:hypothetical protein n=1 Tax=Halobacterium hubeiense TaxID=1407499 RepID=UPI003C71BB9F
MSGAENAESGIDTTSVRTDVTDPDALREELIRLAEDCDEGDLETAEDRTTNLLSDIRYAIQHGGGA